VLDVHETEMLPSSSHAFNQQSVINTKVGSVIIIMVLIIDSLQQANDDGTHPLSQQ
jgi:hypothetical protein